MSHPILQQLDSQDPAQRQAACQSAAADPGATLLAEALGTALGDPVKAVGRAASDALVAIARRVGADDVQTAVRVALHSQDPPRRWRAAFTAARLDPPGPRLLPALVEAIASTDGDVRWAAAKLMVEMGHSHGEVLPVLIGLVRTGESPVVRRMATFALRELAPGRAEAAEILLEAAGDTDLGVRRAAFTAMASLIEPPPQVAEYLLDTLHNESDPPTRRLAVLALGEIGAQDPDQLPRRASRQLEQTRSSSKTDPDLRRAIDRALTRLGAGRPRP
ncbi:MAG: hypothetical protein GY723_02790 [bacterium]|nr:hypothetical protein [bacterium]MCP5067017.1 hypothetical protein [bacterium]